MIPTKPTPRIMNIKKSKLDLYKALYIALRPRFKEILTDEQCRILHLYLMEDMGYIDIATKLNLPDFHIIKSELEKIKLEILALA